MSIKLDIFVLQLTFTDLFLSIELFAQLISVIAHKIVNLCHLFDFDIIFLFCPFIIIQLEFNN
jgi:hypothetical protein